jgi:hypothetical protein
VLLVLFIETPETLVGLLSIWRAAAAVVGVKEEEEEQ